MPPLRQRKNRAAGRNVRRCNLKKELILGGSRALALPHVTMEKRVAVADQPVERSFSPASIHLKTMSSQPFSLFITFKPTHPDGGAYEFRGVLLRVDSY